MFAVALLIVPVLGGVSASTRAAACSRTPTVGLEPRVQDGGRYLLSVPAIRDRAPLLVALHGSPRTPEDEAALWQWERVAKDFIVAYPSRDVHTSTNDTPSATWDWSRGSPDVRLVRSIINSIVDTYCVDPARIHVTGSSGGAYLAQRMACDASDILASIGEYAGGRPDDGYQTWGPARPGDCRPTWPVSVIMFHGTADTNVSVDAGRMARYLWANRLGCMNEVTRELSNGSTTRLAPCSRGTEVRWREYSGDDHYTTAVKHLDEIRRAELAFFAAHPRAPG